METDFAIHPEALDENLPSKLVLIHTVYVRKKAVGWKSNSWKG